MDESDNDNDNDNDNSRPLWANRYRAILSFDFEAAVHLKRWNDLGVMVEESQSIADTYANADYDQMMHLYSVFADLLLCSESAAAAAPINKVMKVLEACPKNSYLVGLFFSILISALKEPKNQNAKTLANANYVLIANPPRHPHLPSSFNPTPGPKTTTSAKIFPLHLPTCVES
jgi:hypothetical protein